MTDDEDPSRVDEGEPEPPEEEPTRPEETSEPTANDPDPTADERTAVDDDPAPLDDLIADATATERRGDEGGAADETAEGPAVTASGEDRPELPEADRSVEGPAGSDRSGEGPLDDIAESVRSRRDADDAEPEGLFEPEDVPEIDPELVWEELETGESAAPDGEPAERAERLIDKSSYCERCEFFAEPPEMRCTHEGTEIVELVEMDRVRVLDCPKIAEDERLEKL